MELALIPLLAFTPGMFWLWFFVRKDVYRPEPRRMLAITFLLGMVATVPAGIINTLLLDDAALTDTASLASVASGMLFVVGPTEEICKFLAVRAYAYRSRYFDEPSDGLVYSVAASLGFASLENVLYILMYSPAVMLLRAPLSTVAHVVFGSFWGYALGQQVQEGGGRRWQTPVGIAAGALAHGLFNVTVFAFWPAGALLVILGVAWTLGRFTWGQRVSPFRYRRNYPTVDCGVCGQRIRIISRYCRFCGSAVAASRRTAPIYCGHCRHRNRPDADYCSQCGDRLLRQQ